MIRINRLPTRSCSKYNIKKNKYMNGNIMNLKSIPVTIEARYIRGGSNFGEKNTIHRSLTAIRRYPENHNCLLR